MDRDASLAEFHPAVARWFARRFPGGPTAPQVAAWPAVRSGADVVVAAPTGSGKTLAAFLVLVDRIVRAAAAGRPCEGTLVVYVSPLKALAADVHANLLEPVAEIADEVAALGGPAVPLTVGVRTGDTSPSERAALVRRPPTILVTTPESLYLLLTAESGRAALRGVRTVVVDEAHATARDKRGAHLAVSLERLQQLQGDRRLQRVALSATQRPIDAVARSVTGTCPSPHGLVVVDLGPQRRLQLTVEVPGSALEAVASSEQLGEVVDRLAAHVMGHRTTLVFVNTRRMAERLARLLGERVGEDQVVAHHGSMAADRRADVEARLRAGALRALVATASLELGIDVGPVDLVCQVGSPRQVSTFLQRVGRANHRHDGVPAGVVLPLTRDDLVECVALVGAAHAGVLDRLQPPEAPLDVLLQQMVAEVAAAGEVGEDDLYALVRRAAPYAALPRWRFDEAVRLLAEGIPTGRGRCLAYLHHDQVHRLLRPRRGARLVAVTCGGTIPDVGDYRVVLDPDDAVVGSVDEDFAIESMVGDVFVLGTRSWRVRRVEPGVVRVVDAAGAAPTVPFWIGEAPSRSRELSDHVADLRALVARAPDAATAVGVVVAATGVGSDIAEQVVEYLRAAAGQLGVLPSRTDVVVERFFDETDSMQLVVHAPLGGRITRALGLALRKRLCATYDFELQAAANDDAVLVSLGAKHAFALDEVMGLLRSVDAERVVTQAVLTAPAFRLRWRHTCCRALAIRRQRGGRRTPLVFQRMEADDLMGAVFPALAACQENTWPGPVTLPEHPLVHQTMHDCLHELLDVDGLVHLLEDIEAGRVRVHCVERTEPSLLAHEILSGKPYTFLDDAPLEERRARTVPTERGLPRSRGDGVDADAVDAVTERLRQPPRDREELHDLLLRQVVTVPDPRIEDLFEQLVADGRAAAVVLDGQHGDRAGPDRARPNGTDPAGPDPAGPGHDGGASSGSDAEHDVRGVRAGAPTAVVRRWCAAERRRWVELALPGARFDPDVATVDADGPKGPDQAHCAVVEGHLATSGPVTVDDLAGRTGVPVAAVRVALAELQHRGVVLPGRHDPRLSADEQWCDRSVLARVHAEARRRRRAGIEPVTAQGFVRFALAWQHVAPGTQRSGRAGLLAVVEQIQGIEAAAGVWEPFVLASRLDRYRPPWLDDLCQAGRVAWARLGVRPAGDDLDRRTGITPSAATPITLALRSALPWLLTAARGDAVPAQPAHGSAADVLAALRADGAAFPEDLVGRTRRLPDDVDAGLWDLVARGLVAADGFAAVRRVLGRRTGARGRRRRVDELRDPGGRWSLLPDPAALDASALAELVARQLLDRWGVVCWEVAGRETLAVPWRRVVAALERLEDRGEAIGGRFVTGCSGRQFAHPQAPAVLAAARVPAPGGPPVVVHVADPLNLLGMVLPGPRPAANGNRAVVYRDGAVVDVVERPKRPRPEPVSIRTGSGRVGAAGPVGGAPPVGAAGPVSGAPPVSAAGPVGAAGPVRA